jgi:hypothetical protein
MRARRMQAVVILSGTSIAMPRTGMAIIAGRLIAYLGPVPGR